MVTTSRFLVVDIERRVTREDYGRGLLPASVSKVKEMDISRDRLCSFGGMAMVDVMS